MSQIDIAKWSGRKNIQQNNAYDHMTSTEMISLSHALKIEPSQLYGSLGDLVTKTPISRDEFFELEFPTAHTTEIGYCIHDFSMLPCDEHRDCINCSEHIYVKENSKQVEQIRKQLEIMTKPLKKAELAKLNQIYGADRWHQKHKCCVERLRSILKYMDDPNIPNGAIFRIVPEHESSRIILAMAERDALDGKQNSINYYTIKES